MDLLNENMSNDDSYIIKTDNYLEVEVPLSLLQCLESKKSLENFCRICLSSNENLKSLFTVKDHHKCLADLLKSLASVKIIPDNLMPNKICVKCETSLVQSYNFKIKCEKAECALQSILKGQFVPANDDVCIGGTKNSICNLSPNGVEIKEEDVEIEDLEYLHFNDSENDEENLDHMKGKGVDFYSQDPESLLQERYSKDTELDPVKINTKCQKISRLTFTCNMCFEEFNNIKNYKKHITEKHGTDKQSHPCSECKEQFSTQHDLQLHSVIHMAGPLWTCRECPKQFKTKTLIKRHLRRHMDSKGFKCSSCAKSFTEFYALRRHSRVHTGEIVEKKHVCNICNKKYRENSLLVAHMASHDSVRPFVCATCGKTFVTARLLNSHSRIHSENKQYACKFCDKRFRHDSTRNTHQRTHTGERPYVCSICGKRFIQNSNLRLHMRTHTGERPYSCDDCDKMFTSGSALKTHRRRHTGEKPYSCNICNKRFARMDLTAHMRQHTGERPYACSVCPKKFVNATRLRDHCRTHTGEKPYECASCTKTFPTKSHLVKHVKKHQPKKKHEKKGYFVVPHMEPVQYIITDEKEISETDQSVAKDQILIQESKKSILQDADDNLSVEVSDNIVLQDNGEVLVVDNSQNQGGNIYLSTGVTECTGFTNDVSLVAVNGEGVNISASSAVLEGSTVKLYQLDQSLVQIHRSGGQVTISKITSKMTANF